MKNLSKFAALVILVMLAFPTVKTAVNLIKPGAFRYIYFQQHQLPDFAERFVYRAANTQTHCAGPCVVFLGDSITEFWKLQNSFPNHPFINRGIRGQATSQMILRFRQDVLDLHPTVVLINGGVNDLSNGTSPSDLKAIEEDYETLADLALANHITPVFTTVLPINTAVSDHWDFTPPDKNPAIRELNAWLQNYCAQRHIELIDYAPLVSDSYGRLRSDFTADGVHPNSAGYAAMATALDKSSLGTLAAAH